MGEISPPINTTSAPLEKQHRPPAHVLIISFHGQGHINPFLRFAKRLAAKGLLVTFTTVPSAGRRILASTENPAAALTETGVPIGSGYLRFEFLDFDDGPTPNDLDVFMPIFDAVGPKALTDLINRQAEAGRPVSCFVNNPFIPWAVDVVDDLGIPCAVLWCQSCAVFSVYHYYHHRLAKFPTEDDRELVVNIPGIPALPPDDLPSYLLPDNPFKVLTTTILGQFHNMDKARWLLANSFLELESDAVNSLSTVFPVIPAGPLVELDDGSPAIKGDMNKAATDCVDWLDAQPPLSVVYVSIGSVAKLTKDEMSEMAGGIKSTGRPFLWVVRDDSRDLLPEGFVEENPHGRVVGWSPQDRVLAHGSLGCFMTHCGWNSTLEVLAAGVPVVAFPQWGDQTTNAKFLTEIYGVGARLASPVLGEKLREAVESVMAGPESKGMRERAKVWKEKVRLAVAEGGSSDRNVQAFVDEIRKMAS